MKSNLDDMNIIPIHDSMYTTKLSSEQLKLQNPTQTGLRPQMDQEKK